MRSLMRTLMGIAFAVLLIAEVAVPVTCAEGQAAPDTASIPCAPVLAQAVSAPAENVLPAQPERRQQERAAAPHTEDRACVADIDLLSDGNGWPVTARTWTKAVYSVCPPEGMPG